MYIVYRYIYIIIILKIYNFISFNNNNVNFILNLSTDVMIYYFVIKLYKYTK